MKSVLVINCNYEPIGRISIERAVVLLVLKKASSIKDTSQKMRSPSTEITIPSIIRVESNKFMRFRRKTSTTMRNLKSIYSSCIYCSSTKNLTREHVIPVSRFNEFKDAVGYDVESWENVTLACMTCNNKKGNKLLSELSWPTPKLKPGQSEFQLDWATLYDELSNQT